jgi:hypothetical protein
MCPPLRRARVTLVGHEPHIPLTLAFFSLSHGDCPSQVSRQTVHDIGVGGWEKHRITLLCLLRLTQPLVSTLDSLLARHNDHFSWAPLLSLVRFSFLMPLPFINSGLDPHRITRSLSSYSVWARSHGKGKLFCNMHQHGACISMQYAACIDMQQPHAAAAGHVSHDLDRYASCILRLAYAYEGLSI